MICNLSFSKLRNRGGKFRKSEFFPLKNNTTFINNTNSMLTLFLILLIGCFSAFRSIEFGKNIFTFK